MSRVLRWARGTLSCAAMAALALPVFFFTVAPAGATEAKPFGIESFAMEATERTVEKPVVGGEEVVNPPYRTPLTQAGAHPWGLTIKGAFTSETIEPPEKEPGVVPTRDPKDIVVDLPPGLLGDSMATPRCPLMLVTSSAEQCPADTQIGVYVIRWVSGHRLLAPVVNVTPETGQSAEFALENTTKIDTPLVTGRLVRTPQGYGFATVNAAIPQLAIQSFEITIWGVPADTSHDAMRGRICRSLTDFGPISCEGGGEAFGYSPIVPFVTLPTDCMAGTETAMMRADSWEEPGTVREGKYYGFAEAKATMPGVTGCDLLKFAPSVEVHPDTLLADEPVGLNVDLSVPLSETAQSNATPQLRNTTVTLPDGVSISPGIVDGIQACDEFGPEGINITGPESEEVGLNGELQLAPGHCPDASIVGTAEAVTSFLPVPVKGHVYLARPGCGGARQSPCTEEDARDGNLYRLYLELGGTGELAQTGVHFKVPLETHANLATGQLTTTTLETPQAPFSELKIHLNGGPRAPLANPAACGPAVTTAVLTPWSAPGMTPEGLSMPGTPDAVSSSSYEVLGCASPPGLHPGFLAGAVAPRAGQFSAFTLDLSRQDREQYIKGVQLHTPQGLLAMLSSVSLCGEAQANAGTCSQASKIGTTRVASGAGSHPFEIEGDVYLTGPYREAPFGLSIVTHVVAGPFNLGLVVVRARINIDPETSTAIITLDEAGPHAVPQIIFGVPLRLQRVTANIDRPGFMLNPTSCRRQQITAAVSGNQNAVASVTSPFAVGGCNTLEFKPSFTAITSGHTSRASGASLDVKLSFPKHSLGRDANIAKVKVSLPRQLPSRLTTLQKACPAATFDANPATCSKGSVVGIARTTTPILPVGLSGPVYFVSHGGGAFPQLVVVLEGDGVRVDLAGSTFISKAGITSSTFKTVPDVPVSSFELYLQQGKGSALAANGDLCKSRAKLAMPTTFVAQNGIQLRRNTKITVSGCPAGKGLVARRHATRHGRSGK